jgi:hypothetical protein
MKKHSLVQAILLFIASSCFSQKEFFRSQQTFNDNELNKFFSSITIHDSLVLFNATDYTLYTYNKNSGVLKWSYETGYKTTIPVFVAGNIIYAAVSADEKQQAAQISLADGKLIKTLPFGPLLTKPTIKNDLLFGTAIYNYGCIIAYDLRNDTVAWNRFVAHGSSREPYYLENKIMANAEGNAWVELGYDGILLDTTCAVKASVYIEDIPCVKTFIALSHDGLQIKGRLAANIFMNDFNDQPDIITTKRFTYVLFDGKLSILSGKLKLKHQLQVSSLLTDLGEENGAKLLKADDENVWLLYNGHLLQYNHKTKNASRITDLTAWQPQQVLMDEGNIWLISRKDGLLYGLSL